MMRHDTVFEGSALFGRYAVRTALAAIFVVTGIAVANAAVVSRGGDTTTPASRASSARMPSTSVNISSSASTSTSGAASAPTTTESAPAPAPSVEPAVEDTVIENKSAQFGDTLSAATTNTGHDTNADRLADQIQRQRAALDAQSDTSRANAKNAASTLANSNTCDSGLRACMQQKCGEDFTDCAGDGDTIFGDKLDACRRDLNCTGHQYQLFTAEIKADRDQNAKMALYNRILDCGNSYNDCIISQCGTTFNKCLGKAAGDAAISACDKIAKQCVQEDNGLASRAMDAFGTLRQDAEKLVARDEQKLYTMRDQMRTQCQRIGAMFDERSFVCVFTVNFFAGNSETPTASQKLYAGGSFNCTQDWFGIDITTFKENAYRYTRSITSATSAMLGSGLGQGIGAITSGAVDRAVDRYKADKAVDKAQKEYDEAYGNHSDTSATDGKDATDDKDAADDKKKI